MKRIIKITLSIIIASLIIATLNVIYFKLPSNILLPIGMIVGFISVIIFDK